MAGFKAVPQDLADAVARVKTAASGAAAKIQSLRDQISTGMTQADVDSVKSDLNTVADALNAAAADPTPPSP